METLAIVLLTAIVNGLVTWGVVKTELRFLRRDVDHAHRRTDALEERLRAMERHA